MKSERDYGRAYCKWCHKPFTKTHHRKVYCSTRCKLNALHEQKAKYQAKRRLLEKRGGTGIT